MGLSGHIGVTLGRYLHVNTHLWLQPDLSRDDFAVLSESRRMRSNELHYVDHPHMGVLINITPFEPDATLEQKLADSTRRDPSNYALSAYTAGKLRP